MADKLNERAAAISGAVTGGVLHAVFGVLVLGMPGGMMGAYGSMYYGMMNISSPVFGFGSWITGTLLGGVVGAFVGWLIAASYNWGLKKK
jgi:hypothetical protein